MQLNDDGIWATMGFLAQHWEIAGPYRIFGYGKAWATMVHAEGQTVVAASGCRSR